MVTINNSETEAETDTDGKFYLRQLHSSLCWQWEKEEERRMKRGKEEAVGLKIAQKHTLKTH